MSTQSEKTAAVSFHQIASPVHASIVSIESPSKRTLLHLKELASCSPNFIALASAIAAEGMLGK
jgi:hypothetical protein